MNARRTISFVERRRAGERGSIKTRYQRQLRRKRFAYAAIRLSLVILSWVAIVKVLTEIHIAIEAMGL